MNYTIANIKDKIKSCEKNGGQTATTFFTPAEIQEAIPMLKGCDYKIYGGFEDAERKIIIIGDEGSNETKFLKAIRIESKAKELRHRSVLGSILGLGIKREMIGDIIVNQNICDVIVFHEMKKFILNNLQKIGSEKVSVKEISLGEIINPRDNKQEIVVSVASLRIDSLISAGFGLSREKSCILIQQEKVLLNYLPCYNTSKAIKEGDLISVRGYGRIKMIERIGETKKGRTRVRIEKY